MGEASIERAHSRDAAASEPKRHPGARGFVGSGAVEDPFTVSWNVQRALIEVLGRNPPTAGDHVRNGGDVERRAKVHDRDVLRGIELSSQFFRGDPGDAQPPKKDPPPPGARDSQRGRSPTRWYC